MRKVFVHLVVFLVFMALGADGGKMGQGVKRRNHGPGLHRGAGVGHKMNAVDANADNPANRGAREMGAAANDSVSNGRNVVRGEAKRGSHGGGKKARKARRMHKRKMAAATTRGDAGQGQAAKVAKARR